MRGVITLTQYAKAAQILPMAWLTQAEFPAKTTVKQAFCVAIAELPEAATYEDRVIRGGTYKAQAIYAAAQLHDRVTALALTEADRG
jgi:hypothetical protein